MHQNRLQHTSITTGAALLIAALLTPDSFGFLTVDDDNDTDAGRRRVTQALDILWSGSFEAQMAIVLDGDEPFDLLDLLDEDDPLALWIADSLRDFIRVEQDDWVTSRLVEELAWIDSRALLPLFTDALRNRSINVRWRAIQWYADEEDPAAVDSLESLWEERLHAWVRADLMAALVNHQSMKHFDDFLDLSGSDDPRLAVSAIDALEEIGDLRAVPRLVSVARFGSGHARVRALLALGEWPELRPALDALLDASHSNDTQAQRSAVQTLERFTEDDAGARLLEVASGAGNPELRRDAVSALRTSPHAGVTPALIDILHEPLNDQTNSLHYTVLWTLRSRDDPEALPGLLALVPSFDGGTGRTIQSIIDHLSRDRAEDESNFRAFSTDCSFRSRPSAEHLDARRVLPPGPYESARCWSAPAREGDPGSHPRMPAGMLVQIYDHFVRPDAIWVMVRTENWVDCWIQNDLLVEPAEIASYDSQNDDLDEFDILSAELDGPTALGLIEAGLLEVIDPGDRVSGVVLTHDLDRAQDVATMAEICGYSDSFLDRRLLELLRRAGAIPPD